MNPTKLILEGLLKVRTEKRVYEDGTLYEVMGTYEGFENRTDDIPLEGMGSESLKVAQARVIAIKALLATMKGE